MAHNSLNEMISLINQHIRSQETLSELLGKAEALVCVSFGEDFLENSELVLHYYFWALRDLVSQAKELNRLSLGELLKATPRNAIH